LVRGSRLKTERTGRCLRYDGPGSGRGVTPVPDFSVQITSSGFLSKRPPSANRRCVFAFAGKLSAGRADRGGGAMLVRPSNPRTRAFLSRFRTSAAGPCLATWPPSGGWCRALLRRPLPASARGVWRHCQSRPSRRYVRTGRGDYYRALSRIRWLFVIARNSTFTYKGQG
jgi:hypothetical protein